MKTSTLPRRIRPKQAQLRKTKADLDNEFARDDDHCDADEFGAAPCDGGADPDDEEPNESTADEEDRPDDPDESTDDEVLICLPLLCFAVPCFVLFCFAALSLVRFAFALLHYALLR